MASTVVCDNMKAMSADKISERCRFAFGHPYTVFKGNLLALQHKRHVAGQGSHGLEPFRVLFHLAVTCAMDQIPIL